VAQFDADKLLFKKWAGDVGIYSTRSEGNHHRELDDPEISRMVQTILSAIHELFSKAEDALSNLQYTAEGGPRLAQDATFVLPQYRKSMPTSRKSRIGWALRGKARFIGQVHQFGALVERLRSLVPLDRNWKPLKVDRFTRDNVLGPLSGMNFPLDTFMD
jgi:hypothetical protein